MPWRGSWIGSSWDGKDEYENIQDDGWADDWGSCLDGMKITHGGCERDVLRVALLTKMTYHPPTLVDEGEIHPNLLPSCCPDVQPKFQPLSQSVRWRCGSQITFLMWSKKREFDDCLSPCHVLRQCHLTQSSALLVTLAYLSLLLGRECNRCGIA